MTASPRASQLKSWIVSQIASLVREGYGYDDIAVMLSRRGYIGRSDFPAVRDVCRSMWR